MKFVTILRYDWGMTDIFFIRWCNKRNPQKLAFISAHRDEESAAAFVAEKEKSGRARPEIRNQDQGVIGAYKLATRSMNLEILQRLEDQSSIEISVDPNNPSELLRNYHSMRGQFSASAGVPIHVIRTKKTATPTARAKTPASHPRTN